MDESSCGKAELYKRIDIDCRCSIRGHSVGSKTFIHASSSSKYSLRSLSGFGRT